MLRGLSGTADPPAAGHDIVAAGDRRSIIGAATTPARTATPHPRPSHRLLAGRVHAHREARRSSLEQTAPASAGSRSFRTGKARRPGLPGTPRGSRARTDHMSRSSPATCRSQAPSPRHCIDTHHVTPASPARPVKRPGRHRLGSESAQPAQGLRPATRAPAASPPINTERPLPLPDTGQPGPDMRPASKDSGDHCQVHADGE
jgi:hypothetical protein